MMHTHFVAQFPTCFGVLAHWSVRLVNTTMMMTDLITHNIIRSLCLLLVSMAAHGELPTEVGMKGLIGSKFGGYVLDAQDINGLSPVCKLIATLQLTDFWFDQVEHSSIMDQPDYLIAKGVKSYHHVCWSQVARTRYYRERDGERRAHLAKLVASEISFVIEHPEYRPQDWPYLTILYVERGKGYLLSKNNARALADFNEALRLDVKNKDAYLALSNLYEDLGQQAKALEYATEGLRHAPTAVSLKRRYTKLGGKVPFPEPYPATPANSKPTPGTEAKPVKQASPSPDTKPEVPTPAVPGDVKAPGARDLVEPPVSAPGRASGPPFCRFCP